MSTNTRRGIYLVEFLVLGLPSVLSFGLLAGLAAFLSGYLLLMGFGQVLIGGVGGDEASGFLSLITLAVLMLALCFLGSVAIFCYLRLSIAFLRDGPAGLAKWPHDLARGAACALLALPPMWFLAASAWGQAYPMNRVVAFYLAGGALLLPILHLWLEIRRSRALA